MAYNVIAKRWEHGWELHIDGIGVTQSHLLSGAPQCQPSTKVAHDLCVASMHTPSRPSSTGRQIQRLGKP